MGRFNIRDAVGNSRVVNTAVEELAKASGYEDTSSVPRGSSSPASSRSTGLMGGAGDDIDVPQDELDQYWRYFESVPMVRESIRAFAAEVVRPGYYIEAPNDEAKQNLERWAESCAIVSGLKNRDLRPFLKKAVIQREVRGTVMIEKATDSSGSLSGFFFIPLNKKISFQTYPNQPILLDKEPELPEKADKSFLEDMEKAEDGYAAYIQEAESTDGEPVLYTVDEIIKLTRDADIGEILGTSRLEAVAPRIDSLRKKLKDNDQAIESMAWKFWLFLFGSEDDPWPEDDVEEFMSHHEADDFQAGKKQGVTGDVDIETISGEVADISDALEFDINWIMSAMPLPKYALGGFEQYINQFVSRSQEQRIEFQIEAAQDEIATEFTPAFQEKAIQENWISEDEKNEVQLKIGIPPEERQQVLVERNEKVNESRSETDYTRPPASSEQEAENAGERRAMRDETETSSTDAATTEEASSASQSIDPDQAENLVGSVDELAQYTVDQEVETPKGQGVILEIVKEPFDFSNASKDDSEKVHASPQRPKYIVAFPDGDSDYFTAGQLTDPDQ